MKTRVIDGDAEKEEMMKGIYWKKKNEVPMTSSGICLHSESFRVNPALYHLILYHGHNKHYIQSILSNIADAENYN